MSADDMEMYLLKALAVIQRGLTVGHVNAMLDQRKANASVTSQMFPRHPRV
jgi:hypothetical protein